jgi:hypothetical protein
MLIIFFDIKGIARKGFVLAGQTVNFTYDCVNMCEDFAPNFGVKRTGCCITTAHRLTLPSSPGNFFTKNNMTVAFIHPNVLFTRSKIKLKCRHFDTIEVIETESQAILNILVEHDFQDAF